MKTSIAFALVAFGFLCPRSRVDADQPNASKRPNILWLIGDNMGPDLGCYGAAHVKTPYLDKLAAESLRFQWAFNTSSVCSPSRSAFMTGMYQTTIGAHNHRSHRNDHFHLPKDVRPITHWFVDAGYTTANISTLGEKTVGRGKTDLNFEVEGPLLRETAKDKQRLAAAKPGAKGIDSSLQNTENEMRMFHTEDWGELKRRQPFFAQINFPVVERNADGFVGTKKNPAFGTQFNRTIVDPDQVTPPAYFPNHPISQKEWATYLDCVCNLDDRIGEILMQLEKDGLADDTIVVFFSDNGRLDHRSHGWCYDSGDRVPLMVRWPKNFSAPEGYRAGGVRTNLVSLLDLTATTLAFAGIPRPDGMQSRIFMGAKADPPRAFVVSARDRHDEAVNRIRALRTPRYRYIRNFMPEKGFLALHRYREACYPVIPLLRQLHADGKLTGPTLSQAAARLPDEELYDLDNDPDEVNNLANGANLDRRRVLESLRAELNRWIEETKDRGANPESPEDIRMWIDNMDKRFGTPAWAK